MNSPPPIFRMGVEGYFMQEYIFLLDLYKKQNNPYIIICGTIWIRFHPVDAAPALQSSLLMNA